MLAYHLVIVLVLLGMLLMLLWNLRVFYTVPVVRKEPPEDEAPWVSVLIPARNEAHRITPCARSLLAQYYPASRYEVIVLDDNSEDGTSDVLRGLGYSDAPDARFRIIRGEPLPEGWTGKAWACHQLARSAKASLGDYLLFLDADTEQIPQMLPSAVAFAREMNADLLSAWPRLDNRTWSEKLILPMIHLSLVFFPHALWQWLMQKPERIASLPKGVRRFMGAANGQFLLFRREAYQRIGGHEAQKSHMVEDVALGRAMAGAGGEGLRLINADGSSIASVRMYTCFAEVWEGLTKNIRAAFEGALILYLLTGYSLLLLFIFPYLWIWLEFGTGWWLVALQLMLIYLIRFILTVRFRTSWWAALLHPVAILCTMAIALNSWRRSAGAGVTWKGRLYEVVHPKS